MAVTIRDFQKEDVPYKVKWINSSENNQYLHYDLPLNEENTYKWFETLKDRKNRADYTIMFNDQPAGLIGLLNIDFEAGNAEYYICLGGNEFKGKGIAQEATRLLLVTAKDNFHLNEVYLYTEVENIAAQKSFEKTGFIKQPIIDNHLVYNGRNIDRFYYIVKLNEVKN